MESIDAVVIGAGVVGLAVGRELAQRGLETVVLERANAIGTETSARNSEVIHAGIYYATGSLKARLCVAGKDLLYEFCEGHGVAYRRCGKLLVASNEVQAGKLEQIRSQAARHGVDLVRMSGEEARAMEPALNVVAALHSPSTGIVDSHGLMLALQGDLEAAGGAVALLSPALSVEPDGSRHRVSVGGETPMELSAKFVVNSAGLWAPDLARHIAGPAPGSLPVARYAKGNYFSLSGRAPFQRLIYPIPEEAGLGVHLTLDLAGQARFGPDVEWITPANPEGIDYRVNPARIEGFEEAIRAYWPGLPEGALQAAYSGVRPKLQTPGQEALDFMIQGPAQHGVAGLVNLFGIESPGLTSSLALAREVLSALVE